MMRQIYHLSLWIGGIVVCSGISSLIFFFGFVVGVTLHARTQAAIAAMLLVPFAISTLHAIAGFCSQLEVLIEAYLRYRTLRTYDMIESRES